VEIRGNKHEDTCKYVEIHGKYMKYMKKHGKYMEIKT
jgi:hypothetical protein